MNNIENWNRICELHKDYRFKEEYEIQRLWEKIFEQYFHYNSLDNEIASHGSLQIGSRDKVIPDILLRKNNNNLVIIELKRGNAVSSESYKNQLFSYLKQFKLSLGILITSKIEVFVYDYSQDDNNQKSIEIEFTKDNSLGEQFMSLFDKVNLDFDKIKEFVDANSKVKGDKEKIENLTDEKLIKDVLSTYYKEQGFNEISITDFLKSINISIIKREEVVPIPLPVKNKIQTGGGFNKNNSDTAKKDNKNNAIRLCQKYNLPISNYITYASLSGINGKYPANVNLSYLDNEWTILLDDKFHKKLHVLKVPANTFSYNDFYIRADRNLLVLAIDNSFVDSHPQNNIQNRFFEYKIQTIDYSN